MQKRKRVNHEDHELIIRNLSSGIDGELLCLEVKIKGSIFASGLTKCFYASV